MPEKGRGGKEGSWDLGGRETRKEAASHVHELLSLWLGSGATAKAKATTERGDAHATDGRATHNAASRPSVRPSPAVARKERNRGKGARREGARQRESTGPKSTSDCTALHRATVVQRLRLTGRGDIGRSVDSCRTATNKRQHK